MSKNSITLHETNRIFPKTHVAMPENCIEATFVKRHKRFTVQAIYENAPIVVHSNNSGSMLGLSREGMPILASLSNNPKRKLPYTQEAVWLGARSLTDKKGFWVGVNTSIPNKMLAAGFTTKAWPFAQGYTHFTPEAKCGQSRIDGLFRSDNLPDMPDMPDMWVECKNVTLVEDDVALFPDAVTERGQKHLRELMHLVEQGHKASMLYLVQRPDAQCFAPADIIDPKYAELFWQAKAAGVSMYAFVAHVSSTAVTLGSRLKIMGDAEIHTSMS